MAKYSAEVVEWDQDLANIFSGIDKLQRAFSSKDVIFDPIFLTGEPAKFSGLADATKILEQHLDYLPPQSAYPYRRVSKQKADSALFMLSTPPGQSYGAGFKDYIENTLHISPEPVKQKKVVEQSESTFGSIPFLVKRPDPQLKPNSGMFIVTRKAIQSSFELAVDTGINEINAFVGGRLPSIMPVEINGILPNPASVEKAKEGEFFIEFNPDPQNKYTEGKLKYVALHALSKIAHANVWRRRVESGDLLPSAGLFTRSGPDLLQREIFAHALTNAVYTEKARVERKLYGHRAAHILISMAENNLLVEVNNGANPEEVAALARKRLTVKGHELFNGNRIRYIAQTGKNNTQLMTSIVSSWNALQTVISARFMRSGAAGLQTDTKLSRLMQTINEPKTLVAVRSELGVTNGELGGKSTATGM